MTFGPITVNSPGVSATIGIMGPIGKTGTPGTNGAPGPQGPAVFLPITAWVSGATYSPGTATRAASYVSINGSSYACTTLHTSGVFAIDLAAGLWQAVGSKGDKGDAGTPGSTWYSGSGLPGNIVGINGDYFYRTDTSDVLLKVSGAWTVIGNLRGLPGNTVNTGTGAPTAAIGVNGDTYLDTTPGAPVIWGPKANGAWPASGTSLVGPRGPGTGDMQSPGAGTVKPGQAAVFGADNQHVVGATRTPRGDAAYGIQVTDAVVALTAALTAPRIFTLPAAAALAAGAQVSVVDEAGGVTPTLTLTVARSGTDTVNGGASATIASPYGYLVLESDGASRWTVVDSTSARPGANADITSLSGLLVPLSVGQGGTGTGLAPTDPMAILAGQGALTPGQVIALATLY